MNGTGNYLTSAEAGKAYAQTGGAILIAGGVGYNIYVIGAAATMADAIGTSGYLVNDIIGGTPVETLGGALYSKGNQLVYGEYNTKAKPKQSDYLKAIRNQQNMKNTWIGRRLFK